MAAAAKTSQTIKADPLRAAAVDHFSARSHDAWRRRLLQTNPEQRGKPRLRERGGVMVDINQPWAKLHPKAKADNARAAQDAFDAVTKFPNDREAASEYVHKCWIKRNKHDKSLAKELFLPYAKLSELEKDKDRAHVDTMKKAIAAARKAKRKSRAQKAAPAFKSVRIEAKAWARLEAGAKRLSTQTGQPITPEALLAAGVEAILAATSAVIIKKPRGKKAKRAR